MRKVFVVAAAILAAVLVFLLVTLPPQPRPATGALDDAQAGVSVAGAYHVHSTVSDGAGDREEIARAAARAGLKFVIFTDHGDGTRTPEPPRYAHGVLCVDAVEISTNGSSWTALSPSYGSTDITSWTEVSLPLTAYLGQPTVYIRFHFTSDVSITDDGWFIDDILVRP